MNQIGCGPPKEVAFHTHLTYTFKMYCLASKFNGIGAIPLNRLRQAFPFRMTVRTFVVITMSLLFLFLLVEQANAKKAKIKVIASIFPAFDFARVVGGERVDLQQLLPPGVEAHGFSPTPRDIIRISQADLFFFTGTVMEPRIAKLLGSLDGEVRVVDLSQGLLPVEKKPHDHHGMDPHIWLDPIKAQAMVEVVARSFIQVDPEHTSEYRDRADTYLMKLADLDRKISKGLANCKQHIIISGGHFAFGHFIKRYHLQAISAYPGFSADGKPSPKGITTLLKTMESTGATAVFHEELLNPKVARIIAEESGAKSLLLHAAHNVSRQDMAAGVSYITIMEENLKRLQVGLSCQ